MRDAFFFLLSEIALIAILTGSRLKWWMGAILMGIYLLYLSYLYWEYKTHKAEEEDEEDDEDDEEEEDSEQPSGWIGAILTLNFQWMLYRNKPLTKGRAWVLLIIGTIAIALPCHWLAHACVGIAHTLKIPVFFTTVVLAAAATSVPDTIISVRDARQGDYDDAVSNAFGSNIFDINIALGLPLFLYGLIYGDVSVAGAQAASSTNVTASSAAAVQELQIILLLFTLVISAIFLIGRTMGKVKALMLFSMYGVFLFYTVARVYPNSFPWVTKLSTYLQFSF